MYQEQKQLRPNNEPITAELLSEMTYTRQVVREILRFKPPAPSVPMRACEDFPLTEDFIAPKGSLIIPDIHACVLNYPEANTFNPDRFQYSKTGHNLEDLDKFREHFLVFGTGPHYCMGREYATNHLIAFTALLCSTCDWQRRLTSKSDGLEYLPTIYPMDGCLATFTAKAA